MRDVLPSLRRIFGRASTPPPAANDNKAVQPVIGAHDLSQEALLRALNPPHDATVETLHDITVHDPFRPMENMTAPEVKEWTERQNKRFQDFIAPATGVHEKAVSFMKNAEPATDKDGFIEGLPFRVSDDKCMIWRRKPDEARASLYIRDANDENAPWRLVLDPLKIDPSGRTNVVELKISPDAGTIAYWLSKSGSDHRTLQFLNVETGEENAGESFKRNANITAWDEDGKGFTYTHWTGKTEVSYHVIGTSSDKDTVVYSPSQGGISGTHIRTPKDCVTPFGDYEWVQTHTSPNRKGLLVRRAGSNEEFREIFSAEGATLTPLHEINGKIYAITELDAKNRKVVCFDLNDPAPEKWRTILPEFDTNLNEAFIWQNGILTSRQTDKGPVRQIYDLDGKYLHDIPTPVLETTTLQLGRLQDKECFFITTNFKEDAVIYKYDPAAHKMTLHRPARAQADLKDCIVERMFATSKDGTQVPMTVIRAPQTKLDGSAATLLYGYGGFNIPMQPIFSLGVAQWVREGGIYVQSHLRGGGEFGQAWYDAGRCQNKQNTFDDLIACSEHLIKNKYTSNKRLAIQGGSNGGLLTLATSIQRPDLFGAVISEVPVTDMFRFHIGSPAGPGWKSNYGDPGVKDDFNIAAKYSPLHNVKPGFKHPPILIATDVTDDRVYPWHTYKMAATLQALEDPNSITLMKLRNGGGHGAGLTAQESRDHVGTLRAFLVRTLGPINQNEYKATLPGLRQKIINKLKFG